VARPSLLRLLLLASIWGSSFLWIKIGLDGLSPAQLTLGRVAFGSAFLLLLCLLTGRRLPTGRVVWAHIAFVALAGNAVPFTLFGIGEQTVDSGLAGVLNATTPLWTAVIAILAGQERRPSRQRIFGLALGFAGTVLIVAPWQGGGGSLAGALACTAAAACYGVALVYSARFLISRGIPAVALSAAQITTATGWMLLATPLFGWQPVRLSWPVALAVFVLGVLGSGYAFVLINSLIADDGPTTASTVTYLLPVIAVLLGAVVLGESLGLRVLAGMVVVLAGVFAATGGYRRRPTPAGGRPPSGTARTGWRAASSAAPTTRVSPPS
jgi:drug/metabolite transporter (DMT)-like permease